MMFENIGSKIKTLARVVCWAGIAISFLAAIGIWGSGDESAGSGFMVLLVGSLISWVGSFFTYGFGELIEKVTAIEKNLNKPE